MIRLLAVLSLFLPAAALAVEPLKFTVMPEVALQQLDKKFCWFHPRVAAIPGFGKDGQPAVIMSIQKHLTASDHYSGMWTMRTDDLGKTWTKPIEIPELAWRDGENGETISVCDATPIWHPQSGKLILLGINLRYSPSGEQLLDKPGSHACAYATFDPKTNKWSGWQTIELPDVKGKFFVTAPGCVQWLAKEDGTLLIPVYRTPAGDPHYNVTVLHCKFDGTKITYLDHSNELALDAGRGLYEPSLVKFGKKYYLTLRNDDRGFVTTSNDGLEYGKPKEWTFDDGKPLGNYNTQQHWLAHSGGLFLCYTRKGANNDHIFRHRAPLFIAQVDPEKLQVIRSTEAVLIPERGLPLGNFGASPITANESWVTDAEYIVGDKKHERGGDGSTWIARVKWAKPNQLVESGK